MRLWLLMGIAATHLLAPWTVWAQSQSVTPEDEFKEKIRVSEDIQPLGEHPFGENINLYNGNLSFTQTDVDAPGNGPDIQLSRSYSIPDLDTNYYYVDFLTRELGDWRLNVPRIETLSAKDDTLDGKWFFLDNPQRCSNFVGGPVITVQQTPTTVPVDYFSYEWWHGFKMILSDGGSQDLLKRDSNNTQVPQMTIGGQPISFPVVTKGHWAIGCLSQASNDPLGGEGFIAVSPDGTKYWFDRLVYQDAPMMVKKSGSPLRRRVAKMLVTRIEDRFGNVLTYEYDNERLIKITASDGRKLTLTYESWQTTGSIAGQRLKSVSLIPTSGTARTWTYSYTTKNNLPWLSGVNLPDNSDWTFDFTSVKGTQSKILLDSTTGCQTVASPTGTSYVLSIDHPSGLHGDFTVTNTVRGRSYVPFTCVALGATQHETRTPYAYVSAAVTQKVLSGAGFSNRTWSYQYSPANESAIEDCSSGCTATVWTTVTNPDGHAARYTFSNKFGAGESLLQQVDFYAGPVGSALMRREQNFYADPASGAWPDTYGSSLQSFMNAAQLEQLSPLNERVLVQDGDTYTWQAQAFNAYAQITRTKRFNSIAGQSAIEEQTSYLNDTALWVLGLPLQVDNLTTGETVSQNVYDSSNDTLQSRYAFGQKVMDYTFNSSGQLTSFTDGNNHTTNLSSYKRGVPRGISFPDTTSMSLVVDDFGQISSITDQASHTTSYSYDAVGRLTQITYPSGWNPKTFSYAYITSAERGIAAGHWRRIVTQGNAKTTTWFDATLNPVLNQVEALGASDGATTITTGKAYDWRGRATFASYPVSGAPSLPSLASGIHTVYDALGRTIQVDQDSELGTLITTTSYLSGARVQVTDPRDKVTTTTYQVFDQPGGDKQIKVQAPESVIQTIVRDIYGKPLSITQSGGGDSVSKTLVYDSYQRLCRTSEPESGSAVVDYDAANNIAWSASGLGITGTGCGREQVPAASKVTRGYDAMNRVLSVSYPDTTAGQSYTYDALGNVASAASGLAIWTYAYDAHNQLTSETLNIDGYSWPIGYGYDANGSLASTTYPYGKVIGYSPDPLGRPTQAGNYASGGSYLADGSIESFVYMGGATYLVQKNARHLLSNLTYADSSGGLVYSQDLSYDPNGNITSSTDLTPSATRSKTMTYDGLDRLTDANAPNLWGDESYTYDALNNIRSMTSDGLVRVYNYDATNRLANITAGGSTLHSFVYDSRGNATLKDSMSLVFDLANRLTQVTGITSYEYDASGRRVKKAANDGTTTYYAYNGAGKLMWQYVPTTATTGTGSDYVYLGGKMIAKLDHDVSSTAPDPVASVTVPSTSTGSISVQWPASTYAMTYRVDQQLDGGGWSSIYSGENLSTTKSEGAGGSYVFRVAACNPAGCSAYTTSSAVTVSPQAAPSLSVPGGTSASGNFTVSWGTSGGATSYTVQEQVNGGGWSQIYSGAGSSQSISGKGNGTYGYRVQACNAVGCGPWSGTQSVTVLLPPSVPSTITVPATSSGSVAVNWSSASTATSYTLQHQFNGGAWSTLYSGASTSYNQTETATGSYAYRAQACNSSGCSSYTVSSAVAVTIPPDTAPSLSAPSTSSTGSYTVSWGTVGGAATYTLQQQVNGGSWSTGYNGSGTSKSYSGQTNGADYGYRVQACNVGGCGPWSGTKTTHIAIPPPVPTNVKAIDDFPNSKKETLTVTWSGVSGASSYKIKQEDTGTVVYTGTSTSVVVESVDVPYPILHTYAVQSCNAYACSSWVHAQNAPAAPSYAPSLSAPSGSSNGSYTVSWGTVQGATSYTLQQKVSSGSWSSVYTGSGTSKSFSGKADGSYSYRVKACNGTGCSSWSSTKTVVVAKPPPAPTNARVIDDIGWKYETYTAAWNASSGATSYQAKRNDTGASTYSGTNTSYIIANVPLGGIPPYQSFSVRACNAVGCSSWVVGN